MQRKTKDEYLLLCMLLAVYGFHIDKKKRKLFYNDCCRNVQKFLNKVLASKLQLTLDSFLETTNTNSYLCHFCDAQATKFFKLKDELSKVDQYVVEHVSQLTRLASSQGSHN